MVKEYKDTYLPNSIFADMAQVCIVTWDLDKTIRAYAKSLGIGPWWVYDCNPPDLRNRTYRGEIGTYRMKIGLAWSGLFNWEIIEPTEGPSIYHDFLNLHGEGVHHIAGFLKDTGMSWDECYRVFADRGFDPIQEGKWGEVRFCYFNTEQVAHTTIEVLERKEGWVRPEPTYWYPAKS